MASELDAPSVKQLEAEFNPTVKAWPVSWSRRDIKNTVYTTFGLFARPSAQEMAERLLIIETHPNEFLFRAIRQHWNVKELPEYYDGIIADFRTTYPDLDKADWEIAQALKMDIYWKKQILSQAAREDGTERRWSYRMLNNHLDVVCCYPRFKDAIEGTGRHDDPLATINKLSDWGEKLRATRARREHQRMSELLDTTATVAHTARLWVNLPGKDAVQPLRHHHPLMPAGTRIKPSSKDVI